MKHVYRTTVDRVVDAGSRFELSPDAGHHLVRVARREVGEAIEVIDPDGAVWPGSIVSVGPPVVVEIGSAPIPTPPPVPIELCIGTLEWGRFDLVVEKCTEMGIAGITMFSSARANRRVDAQAFARRVERLTRLADAAAKQSGRGRRPQFHGLVPFSTVITDVVPHSGFIVDLSGDLSLGQAIATSGSAAVTLLVGPDTGFTADELDAAKSAGLVCCTLGGATLRAETAALTSVSIASDRLAEVR